MKAEELRIGNWVSWNGENGVVAQILEHEVVFKCGEDTLVSELEPIELTEGILMKCGFENVENFKTNKVFSKNRLYLTKWIDKDFFIADWNYKKIKNIQHLHQLQNLYYALCNEELNVKL